MNFTDTKILLSNYPNIQQRGTFQQVGGEEKIDILCGYDIKVDARQVAVQIANDLITAILTYDNVYVEGNHVWDVLEVFGSDYLCELLRSDILHFIPDSNVNPVMMRKSDKIWRPAFFSYPSGVTNEKGETIFKATQQEWGGIETTLFNKGIKGPNIQAFLCLIDEKKRVIDQEKIKEITIKETLNDLKNNQFVEANNILRTNDSGRLEFHQLNILRLHELNTVAVTASLLGADAMKTDGQMGTLMEQKCVSVFAEKMKDGVSAIQSILHKKGFPDLGKLFIDRVINLDDILKLRTNMQGKLFRYWAMNDGYAEDQMQKDIMNSVHTVLGSKISGSVRFLVCSAMGLFSSATGVAASAFDSFILDKVAQGWHPNFFLDDKVKVAIDECIQKKKEEEKKSLLRERFNNVGRNEPCPCGSGKKFKKCHGRHL